MKDKPSERIEDGRLAGPVGSNNGACVLKKGSAALRCIFSNGGGWDHVSVSLATRCPTWTEMDFVKRTFFKDEEVAMQLHVSGTSKVNHHEFCLHLWRPQTDSEYARIWLEWRQSGEEPMQRETVPGCIPLPPTIMV